MLIHFFKVTIRNILRQPINSIISLVGLSLGFASVFIIILFAYQEFSYENFHEKKSRIFRLYAESPIGKTSEINVSTSRAFKDNIPEIEKIAMINGNGMYFSGNKKLINKENVLNDVSIFYASPDFGDVFSFQVLEGDLTVALTITNSIALTEETAIKLFGRTEQIIGKELFIKDSINLIVRAILKDIPYNSSFYFDALIPFNTCKHISGIDLEFDENWSNDTYFLMKESTDKNEVIKKIRQTVFGIMGEDERESLAQFKIDLIPLSKVHFSNPIDFDHLKHGNKNYVYIMFSIGLGILFLALINFINLTIASNLSRSKEIGIKKISGANRRNIIIQLIFESVLFCLFALFLSRIIVEFIFEPFNRVNDYTISQKLLYKPDLIVGSICISIVAGIFSGWFPAMFLTNSKIINLLQNKFSGGIKALSLRKGLVMIQFVISTALIISMLTVVKQIYYLNNKDLGFDKEKCLEINVSKVKNKQAFREAMIQHANIKDCSLINSFLGHNDGNSAFVTIEYLGIKINNVPFKWRVVDNHFFNSTGIRFKKKLICLL